jgi:hypothetical protein
MPESVLNQVNAGRVRNDSSLAYPFSWKVGIVVGSDVSV